MKKKGFVFVETIIVVSVLTVALFLLMNYFPSSPLTVNILLLLYYLLTYLLIYLLYDGKLRVKSI